MKGRESKTLQRSEGKTLKTHWCWPCEANCFCYLSFACLFFTNVLFVQQYLEIGVASLILVPSLVLVTTTG